MPTVNYTPSNTPPDAVALASQTPNNAPPAGVVLSGMAGTGAAPGAIALAAMNPSNAAPGGVALASLTPANGAPAAIALVAQVPSNTAPAPVGGGIVAPTLLNEAPRAIRYAPTPAPLTDNNLMQLTIKIEGALALNQLFGQTRIPSNQVLERVQLDLSSVPVTGPCTVTLVDAAGVSYGVAITVNDGQNFAEVVVPGDGLSLLAGSNVRAKCTATPGDQGDAGPARPGGFGVLTLFTRLAS